MFGFLKKNGVLIAPISGKVIDLSKVPDEVFAQKMAGDGVAIDPTGNIIVAPADGILTLIFRTNHAFAMTLASGIEILVHIGIDTVGLQGEGFKRIATEGAKVKAGDPIIKIDRDFLLSKGVSLITPILITNMDKIISLNIETNKVVDHGKDSILSYKLK